MPLVWDYDVKKLKKSKPGRLLLLERVINFGPDKDEKISLSRVKKNWNKLKIESKRKRYFKFLIWGK